jgi:integrase
MYARDQPPDKPSLALIGYHLKALTPFWGDKFLSDVKGSTCRRYLDHRSLKGGVASSTVRRELKSLQAAINHWHRESPLAAVPKVSLPPDGERRERVLERSEVARLLWAARKLKLPHVARFILIGIYTGTRHNAILSLQWMPNLSGGHIDLARGIAYRRGSAERETSKRRPAVSIPARLGAHLARWMRQDVERSRRVVHYNGSPIAKMKRAWASVVRGAGLGPDVTPHVLRHSCASWLLWEGRTIWDVAGIIGADASTVERVYGHHRRIEAPERARA